MAGFTACENTAGTEKASVASLAPEGENKENAEAITQTTEIAFVEREHDFGLILEGEVVGHTFMFKNTGDKPLTIADVKVTCGCTAPEWPKAPVAPGEEGKIEIKYNSSGKSGLIHKTITVVANTQPAETLIDIKANVRKIDNSINGPVKK